MAFHGSSFWDERDVSLGVPVGCLIVPRHHMAIVKAALSSEGKAGRGVWMRPNGTVPCETKESGGSYMMMVHVSIYAASVLEETSRSPCTGTGIGLRVPQPVRDLLESHQIKWEPGTRLGRPSRQRPMTTIRQPSKSNAILAKTGAVDPPLFRFCELFAGIGGFRLGLESLGGECVFSSEMDPYAADTYALNFGGPPSAGDITTIHTRDIPPHDMLVGGFPCQSFSTAGFQQGLNDHQTANSGRLYLEVCRLLCATRPAAFLLENVANLYIMDGGQWHEDVEQRKPGTTFITILTALETCGYTVRTRVVNAASHGVPQHRDRLFFVGFLDARTMDRFEWPQYHCHPEEDAATSPPPTLGSILECDDSVSVQAAALTRDQYERVQQWLDPLLSAGRSCRAARLDGIARTLMASYRSGWHKHSEFVVSPIVHDSARFYTAREAARIMGFPDGYLIPGHPTRDHGGTAYDEYHRFYHQIGNAVCPPVVKALASSMMSAMNIGNQKNNR